MFYLIVKWRNEKRLKCHSKPLAAEGWGRLLAVTTCSISWLDEANILISSTSSASTHTVPYFTTSMATGCTATRRRRRRKRRHSVMPTGNMRKRWVLNNAGNIWHGLFLRPAGQTDTQNAQLHDGKECLVHVQSHSKAEYIELSSRDKM